MSHNSPRSLRVRADAHNRPDAVWRDAGGEQAAWYRNAVTNSAGVLAGGSDLSQLIAEADAHLAAMRKIVQ